MTCTAPGIEVIMERRGRIVGAVEEGREKESTRLVPLIEISCLRSNAELMGFERYPPNGSELLWYSGVVYGSGFG